jgi:hypothetical protein
MNQPRVEGLKAGLVPHREWAVSRWFYADPVWYYYRRSTAHEICPGGRFYQLVDPELREVCRLLHEAGVGTTPSCQGHSYPRERFERIWEELKREEGPIRGEGLVVKDSESQKEYLFRDAAYRLPWGSFEEFYEAAGTHQNLGYLGVIVPEEMPALAERLAEDGYRTDVTRVEEEPEVGRLLGGRLFGIHVNADDPHFRSAEWRALTEYVGRTLERSVARAAVPVRETSLFRGVHCDCG